MIKLIRSWILSLGLLSLCLQPLSVFAQEAGEKPYVDPMRDITLVGLSTLGGAVLGLSTLPFTEEPGDHLKNILVGGAIGLIVGVALVAYLQADKTQTTYSDLGPSKDFDTSARSDWWQGEKTPVQATTDLATIDTPQLGWSFSF